MKLGTIFYILQPKPVPDNISNRWLDMCNLEMSTQKFKDNTAFTVQTKDWHIQQRIFARGHPPSYKPGGTLRSWA